VVCVVLAECAEDGDCVFRREVARKVSLRRIGAVVQARRIDSLDEGIKQIV